VTGKFKSILSSPWVFVPALYLAWGMGEGGILGNLTGVMYKSLGYSNAFVGMIALLTLPVSFRFLLSPWLDACGTKHTLIWRLHLIMAFLCLGLAVVVYLDFAFTVSSLTLFFIAAIGFGCLAVVTDGYYLRALSQRRQAEFVGIKAAAIRGGIIFGLIFLVRFAGDINENIFGGPLPPGERLLTGWAVAMLIAAGVFFVTALYNWRFLPRIVSDQPVPVGKGFPLWSVLKEYFQQDRVWAIIALILFYRFGQGMVFFMTAPFYMDSIEDGGMEVTTTGVAMLKTYTDVPWMTIGGILGGFIVKRYGLRATFIPLSLFLNLPNLGYVFLALHQPVASFTFLGDAFPTWLFLISCAESFGYGLGFSAFFFYLHAIAQGPNKTSMLAISSGIMGIGFTFPGALAGLLQGTLGFPAIFLIATVIGLLALVFIKLVPIPTLDDAAPEVVRVKDN